MTTTWHAGPELLRMYADDRLDYAAAASVETHLASCGQCQHDARTVAPLDGLTSVWEDVHLGIAVPRPPAALRLLQRLGLRETDAVVLDASASLRTALVFAVVALLSFAAIGSAVYVDGRHDPTPYLLIAPLAPTLCVLFSFDTTDPLRAVTAATSYSKLRLLLLRTVAAASVSLPSAVLFGIAVPQLDATTGVWLLPALAMASLALLLLTWWRAQVVAGLVTVVWSTFVLSLRSNGAVDVIGGAELQILFAALAICAIAGLAVRLSTSRVSGGLA